LYQYGQSALHLAGSADVAMILVTAGANVNLVTGGGRSALQISAEDGSAEVVKILVDNKANLDLVDECGRGALGSAAGKGFADVVKILVDKKANVNLVDTVSDEEGGYWR